MTTFALLNVLLTRQRSTCHNAAPQAMARIWRDGQQKPCSIYRLLTTGAHAIGCQRWDCGLSACVEVAVAWANDSHVVAPLLQARSTRRSSSAS
jgi:hypothetical protein